MRTFVIDQSMIDERRRDGLMVSALDSGSSGAGSSHGRGGEDIVLCSLARHFSLTVPLSTQVNK